MGYMYYCTLGQVGSIYMFNKKSWDIYDDCVLNPKESDENMKIR